MSSETDFPLYREILEFLLIAGVVAPLFTRLRISPILGFLIFGAALGPYGLGALQTRFSMVSLFTLDDIDGVTKVGAFGVVALLFTIGLELSFERLSLMRRMIFGLGLAQFVGSTLLGFLAALAFGQSPQASLIIGAALAMSSTAIVVPLFAEQKRSTSAAARASFAILLFQDLAVAPLLVLIAVMAEGAGSGFTPWLALLPAALGLALIILVGRLVLRPLMMLVASSGSPEAFMAACLLIALGSAAASAAGGASMATGAFIAGLLLAETEYRRAVEATVEPFKGLLLGLFFVSVGASLDWPLALAHPLTHSRAGDRAARGQRRRRLRRRALFRPQKRRRGRPRRPYRAGRRIRFRRARRRGRGGRRERAERRDAQCRGGAHHGDPALPQHGDAAGSNRIPACSSILARPIRRPMSFRAC